MIDTNTINKGVQNRLFWLITEIIQASFLYILAIVLLWGSGMDIIWKVIITIIISVIGYDIIKTFILTRKILIQYGG